MESRMTDLEIDNLMDRYKAYIVKDVCRSLTAKEENPSVVAAEFARVISDLTGTILRFDINEMYRCRAGLREDIERKMQESAPEEYFETLKEREIYTGSGSY